MPQVVLPNGRVANQIGSLQEGQKVKDQSGKTVTRKKFHTAVAVAGAKGERRYNY